MARRHSDETKAAVIAALLEGQSMRSVARNYDIPLGTVKGWKSQHKNSKVITPKKERIGELLLEYLEANLTALRKQAEVFTDPAWLAKQTASDAAVLHGVMTDKAVRLLEAMAKHNGASDTAAES